MKIRKGVTNGAFKTILSDNRTYCFGKVELASLLLFSLVLLYTGVTGIIENKSPENLSSMWNTMLGFVTYFQSHLLILSGALVFTFGIWLFANKINVEHNRINQV